MPYLAVADARLYYQEHGAGDPLVWAHEFCGTGDVFCAEMPPMADAECAAIHTAGVTQPVGGRSAATAS